MTWLSSLCVTVLLAFVWAGNAVAAPTRGALPVSFEPNRGQSDASVKFLSRARDYTLFLTATDAVLGVQQPSGTDVVRMRLVGSNPDPVVEGVDPLPGRSNYFIGADRARWHTNIPTYARVKYRHVYPGVDLVYYGNERRLEYDFVVAPGADPSAIAFAFEGIASLDVDPRGDLVVRISGGELRLRRPSIYQDVEGVRHEIAGAYRLRKAADATTSTEVTFEVAAWDPSRPLVIDPILEYSTYYSSYIIGPLTTPLADAQVVIAVDASGSAYVAGNVDPADKLPTPTGQFGSAKNVFVAKLAPDGATLLQITYLGGNGQDHVKGIAVDPFNQIYVVGTSLSTDFPAPGGGTAVMFGSGSSGNAFDMFVAKLNDAGDSLLYSVVLGGGLNELHGSIAVDASGQAYVVGSTVSSSQDPNNPFPTTANAYQKDSGAVNADVFVARLDTTKTPATSLAYSTLLTAIDNQHGWHVAADSSRHAYVTGFTNSNNFPTTASAYQSSISNKRDAFVTKLDTDPKNCTAVPAKKVNCDESLVYSTYFGGSDQEDSGWGAIAVDAKGKIFVTGFTGSNDWTPASALPNTTCPDGNSFVAKFDPSQSKANSLLYFTCGAGSGKAIAVDPQGTTVYLDSARIDLANNQLVPYPAGFGSERIALDASCNVYATGRSSVDATHSIPYVQKMGRGGALAYVPSFNDGKLVVVDTAQMAAIATLTVGAEPFGVAVSRDGSRAYVTNHASNTVSIVNVDYSTNPPTPTVDANVVPVGTSPRGIGVSPDGTRVYVANYSDTLSVIDTTAKPPTVTTVPLGSGVGPSGVAVHPNGSPIYVTNQKGDSIAVVTFPNNQPKVDTIALSAFDGPLGIVVKATGNQTKLYVTSGTNNKVKVIDLDQQMVTTILVGDNPSGIALHPDGSKVYVANYYPLGCSGGNSVSVILTASDTVTKTVHLAPQCICQAPNPPMCMVNNAPVPFLGTYGVAVDPDGGRVFVSNQFDNTIAMIDTATNTPIDVDPASPGMQWTKIGNGPVALGPFIGPVDRDNDGIRDQIDGYIDAMGKFQSESGVASKKFTNQHLCGTTYGSVDFVPPGMTVEVSNPAGLVVAATGGGAQKAVVNSCGFDVLYNPGGVTLTHSCSSLTAEVLSGPVELRLNGGGVLTVETGVPFKIAETAGGSFLVTSRSLTLSLAPGESATLLADGGVARADTTPPTTAAAATPATPNGANGWYVTNVSVLLTATDDTDGSGVKEIRYALSGAQQGSAVVSGSSAAVPLTAEGATTVTYFAVDNAGNQERPKTLTVQIDKTPPTVSCTVTPNRLWPPNHKLMPVTASVTVADAISGTNGFTLMSVTSSEAASSNDIQGFAIGSSSTAGQLRAERSGNGPGRVYTLTYRALDRAGNAATCSTTVTVPHDSGK